MPDPSSTSGPAARRPRNRLRWVKWIAAIALVALLVGEAIYLWPRLHESWTAVREIHWGWLAACVFAQAVSLSAFGRVQKQLLDAGGVQVRQRKSVAVIYGSTAMSLTLPAGQVFSTAFTYRETRRWGASPVVASWQLAISGVIAAAGLAVLGVAGGLVVGSSFNTFTVVLPIIGVIAIVAAVRYISNHPESIKQFARWGLRKISTPEPRPSTRSSARSNPYSSASGTARSHCPGRPCTGSRTSRAWRSRASPSAQIHDCPGCSSHSRRARPSDPSRSHPVASWSSTPPSSRS